MSEHLATTGDTALRLRRARFGWPETPSVTAFDRDGPILIGLVDAQDKMERG